MANPIRADEWMAALAELEGRSADGFSTEELSEALGVSTKTALLRVNALMRAGRARLAGYRRGVASHGRVKHTPVYQLVKERQ